MAAADSMAIRPLGGVYHLGTPDAPDSLRRYPVSDDSLYSEMERLGNEVGDDFDPELYMRQSQQSSDFRERFPYERRNAIKEGLSSEEFRSRMAASYPDILDWSDLGDYDGVFDEKGLLSRAGKIAVFAASPFLMYHAIQPVIANAAVLEGQLCLQWCPNNPAENVDYYKILYIEEGLINGYPDVYDPENGGSISNWDVHYIPAGQTQLNLIGLNPGRIYHIRATAVGMDGDESGYSANEPIAVAALLGNVDRTTPGSENRVDSHDVRKFRDECVMGSKAGDPGFSMLFDLDGDYDNDYSDYRILRSNYAVVQENEMGTDFIDNSKMVETDDVCPLY